MHGSCLLDVGRGKHQRLNGKQKYNPKEGFVKSRITECAQVRVLAGRAKRIGTRTGITH